MNEAIKYLKILVTIMSDCPEFKYWEPDNDNLKIKPHILPTWVAALNSCEKLLELLEAKPFDELGENDGEEKED